METFKKTEVSSITERLIYLVLKLSEEKQKKLLKELELELPEERRRHGRKPFMTVVDFTSQGRVYREFVNDISEGGVYIQASGPFSVGHDVKMIFSFPGSQDKMKITGHIARVDNTGIGIAFKLSSVDNEKLRTLLD